MTLTKFCLIFIIRTVTFFYIFASSYFAAKVLHNYTNFQEDRSITGIIERYCSFYLRKIACYPKLQNNFV